MAIFSTGNAYSPIGGTFFNTPDNRAMDRPDAKGST